MSLRIRLATLVILAAIATAAYAPPQPPAPPPPTNVTATAVSADGKYFVAGFPVTYPERTLEKPVVPPVTIWDTTTGKEVQTFNGHEGKPVTFVAFTPDAKHVISAGDDRTYRMWSVATGKEAWKHPLEEKVGFHMAALSDDGKTLAIAADIVAPPGQQPQVSRREIRLIDAAIGKCDKTIELPESCSNRTGVMRWAPTGDYLLAGNVLVDVKHANVHKSFADEKDTTWWAGPVTFSPDGKQLLIYKYNNAPANVRRALILWDVAAGKESKRVHEETSERLNLMPYIGPMYFHPTARSYLLLIDHSAGNSVSAWDLERDEQLWVLSRRPEVAKGNPRFRDGDTLLLFSLGWLPDDHVLWISHVDLKEKRVVRDTKFFLK